METINKKIVLKELEKVMDPELGVSITEMELVDKIEVENDEVTVDFHLTAPYCPPMLAMKMAFDIKDVVSRVPGVKSVKLNMSGHYLSVELNKEVNK